MFVYFLFVQLLLSQPLSQSNNQFTLDVTVKNIKKQIGSIRFCLINDDESKFLKTCDKGIILPATSNTVTAAFENLSTGSYCVYVFHDQNNDEELSMDGPFGMPSEPYGFSNNPKSWFGPPKFEKCKFIVNQNKSISIKL